MKKNFTKIFLCLFCLSLASFSIAQESKDSEDKIFEHQIGINATFFIQNFVSLNGGFLTGTPHDVNYKLLYLVPGEKFINSFGLRAGFGYQRNEGSNINVINNTGLENREISYDYRVGFEAQKKIAKYWKCYLGVDYISSNVDNKFKNTFMSGNQLIVSETSDKTSTSGIGPVIGVQFDFNKHISLGTELTFYSTTTSGDRVSSNGFPNSLPQVSKTNSKDINIITPTFVNFIVRF